MRRTPALADDAVRVPLLSHWVPSVDECFPEFVQRSRGACDAQGREQDIVVVANASVQFAAENFAIETAFARRS